VADDDPYLELEPAVELELRDMSGAHLRARWIVEPEGEPIAAAKADGDEERADARYEPAEAETAADREMVAATVQQFATWG
jgi:hypothetical protein